MKLAAVLILTGVVAWPGLAGAASFDCSKASTAAEKAICTDPALSKADEAMAASYKAVEAATLDPSGLRRDQREWLANRDRPDVTHDYLLVYRHRIADLDKQAKAWRALERRFPAAKLKTACFVTPEADADQTCKVEEAGAIGGAADLRYQLQGFFEDKLRMNGGAVVFAPGTGDMLAPVVMAYSDTAHFSPPELFTTKDGTFLWFPGYMEGTGNFNAEHLYLKIGSAWRVVDRDSWEDDLGRRLPKDLGAYKGIYPNYRKMTVSTPLWDREKDGNCCPTGGRADIKLKLVGTRLTIESMTITRGEKAANPDD
jgi:uncharacterized protein